MVVSVEKKHIALRSKVKGENRSLVRDVEAQLIDYGDSQIDNVVISAAVAIFDLKGEDRCQVTSLTEDDAFRKLSMSVLPMMSMHS